MALVNKWPDQTSIIFDNEQYVYNDQNWQTGAPITKDKLENLEKGIRILATQVKAILGEFNPTSLDDAQLNASRLDNIQEWITGSSNTDYSGTNIASRLSGIDTLNSTQNNRLSSIESVNTTQSTNISSLKTRTTNLENRATAIETLNIAQNGRLDSVENKNTEQDGRLDNIDTVTTSQNTEITNLKTRATNIESVNTAQNSRLTALENELSGSGTGTSGSSRLDNIQTWITGSSNGSYESGKDAIMTRLNTDETDIGTLKTDNGTNKTDISNIINEIGGTYSSSTGFANSQISKISSIIETNETQDSNIGKIKIEVWGPNTDYGDQSRIDTLEDGLTETNSTVAAHESRISRIEDGAVAAKIFNYTTINTTASDSLILSANSLIDQNSIVMIFLNVATLGTNNLTIKDSTNIAYNIKINNQTNSNLKAKFAAGSLLGLYRGTSNEVYLFNAPLAI